MTFAVKAFPALHPQESWPCEPWHMGRAIVVGSARPFPAAEPLVLRVRMLGAFEATVGSRRIVESHWRSTQVRNLFAFLVVHSSRTLHQEVLQETFWPDSHRSVRRSLNTLLSKIRGVLGSPQSIARKLESISLTYRVTCDLHELEDAVQRGRRAHGQERVECARRASLLYQGPFLEGCYMDWSLRLREKAENDILWAYQVLAEDHLLHRRWELALEFARLALQLSPYRQDLRALEWRALLGLGRPEEVVRSFDRLRQPLRHELGVEMQTELLRLSLEARLAL